MLDRHLANHQYMCADEYSIADITIWPWYGALALNSVYEAAEFLDAQSYIYANRWARESESRPTVMRGQMVNRTSGPLEGQLRGRRNASDFETSTQGKITQSRSVDRNVIPRAAKDLPLTLRSTDNDHVLSFI